MTFTKKGEFLDILLRSPKTVFSVNDAALLWCETNQKTTKTRLNSYAKKGQLYPLRRGLYAKDKNYNPKELATKILCPAYVSLETVLATAGIIFQYYEKIFVASYVKREIVCDGKTFTFSRLKKETLINPAGLDLSGEYPVATKERAFLDTLYRSKNYYFDNLTPLDWEKVFTLLPIYQNQNLEKIVKKIYKRFLAEK